MDDNIKISIVVPIYNVADYLKNCIESITKQSYKNIEIILVDDGSTDDSPEICDFYAGVDSRIYVIHKKNGGVTSARKAGTEEATGDYILGVDGDDWIEEDRIRDLVIRGIMPAKADMIYMAGCIKEDGEHSQTIYGDVKENTYYGGDIEKQLFPLYCGIGEELFNLKIAFSMYTWAIKSELLREKMRLLDNRILVGEDDLGIGFCLLSAKCVTLINQNGYHYIQRNTSLMHLSKEYGVNYMESTNILYHQLKQYLKNCNTYYQETRQFFLNGVVLRNAMHMHYDMFLRKQTEYLYPFPKVKKGCRIVVYGAGVMGYALMKYVVNSKEYQVTLWVDKNVGRRALPEYKITPVETIAQAEYDYIVIAVLHADVSDEIKNTLINMGIQEHKIARIDPNVITEDALPDEILYDLEKVE